MNPSLGKILIVDDDVDFVRSLSAFLEAQGYTPLKAYDGRAGLRLAKLERPDLIIMDIMMTERTEGFFTVQEIRRTSGLSDVPIFVVSALYSKVEGLGISPESEWLAQDEFFPKPLDMSVLLEKIRERAPAGGQNDGSAARERG